MMKAVISLCLLLFFILIIVSASAQESTEYLWQPTVKLNIKTDSRWSYSFGSAYRNTIYQEADDTATKFEGQHLQFSHNTSYKVGFFSIVSAGIMYRFNNSKDERRGNELRLTQHFNYAKRYNAIRIGHRLKVDERLYKNKAIYRFRYRFAIHVPFSDLKLDKNEFYGVFSTEALSSISQQADPEIDQRFTFSISYQIFKKTILQFGLEYRFEDYFKDTEHRLFFNSGLVFSL